MSGFTDDNGVSLDAYCVCGHRNGNHSSFPPEPCTIATCKCRGFVLLRGVSSGPCIYPELPSAEWVYEQLRAGKSGY